MSTASTRAAICKKISDQFDAMLNPASSAQAATKAQLDAIKSQLAGLSWSSDLDLDGAVDDLESWVNGAIPSAGSDDTDEILDFIKNCPFLSDLFPNPVGLANSSGGSIFDSVKDLISTMGNLIPEFGVGKLLGLIQDSLLPGIPGGLDISNLVKQADQLIECVAGRCGSSYSSRVSTMTSKLQGIYNDYDLDDDPLSPTYGELNLDSIYDAASLTVTNKEKMTKAMESISANKTSAVDSVTNLKSALKSIPSVTGLF